MSCNKVRARLKASQPPAERSKKPVPQFNSMYLRGSGSALMYNNIKSLGAPSCRGCHITAKEMDRVGPEETIRRVDYFAQQMHENATKDRESEKTWTTFLEHVAYEVSGLKLHRRLIKKAVRDHLNEVKKKEEYLKTPH